MRRVAARGWSLVPGGRWDAADQLGAPISSLPVLRGAGRDRDPERAGRLGARHCPSAPESRVELADAVPLLGDEADVHRPPAARQDRLEDAVVAGRVGARDPLAVQAAHARAEAPADQRDGGDVDLGVAVGVGVVRFEAEVALVEHTNLIASHQGVDSIRVTCLRRLDEHPIGIHSETPTPLRLGPESIRVDN